ncbi:hypothetical protein [Streptacidiphilus neutrinimicus]|uniref:hypothetical protein n=1 Tax=Streptacidiphilus neutrinimicus TaxID=105420 RepID=UPI0005AB54A6|nr:hypothetical protein [Streptacidiphilus neutrinimicus]
MRPVRALAVPVLALAGALLTAALSGCASATPPGVSVQQSPSPSGPSFQTRASELASGWLGSPLQQAWEAGYVPLEETTHEPAGVFHSGADKAAYEAGQFRVTVPLPYGPATQTVRFDHGATRTLPALGADQALHTGSLGHCPTASCPTWLTVTAVRATSERVRTSRGEATVPAWAFRIQGYQGEFVYAAVKPEAYLGLAPGQEPTPPAVLPGYQGASLISVSGDGRTLTLGAATGCGKLPPSGLVYETKDVVVIGATDKPAPTTPGTVCAADEHLVRLQVHLGDVLDGRTVLDVATGHPEAALG